MDKKIKILILGTRGFLGQSLLQYFHENKFYDVVFVQSFIDNDKKFKSFKFISHKEFISNSHDNFLKLFKPNIIINLFGQIDIKHDLESCKVQHYEFVKLILKKKIKYDLFIQTGSSAEYSEGDHKKNEDEICVPYNFYGKYKYKSTIFLKKYSNFFRKNIIVLRPFLIFGPNQRPPRLIPYLINCFKYNQPINIQSSKSKINLLYISDFIQLMEKIIFSKIEGFEIFNIGGDIDCTIEDIIDAIIKIKQININDLTINNLGEKTISLPSINKVKDTFNWYPKITLFEALKKIILKDNG